MSTPPSSPLHRPGDRVIRVARLTPEHVAVRPLRSRRDLLPPALALALGFAAMILIGTLLLMLPAASAAGAATGPLEALFTATSAVCVTGLVVVDTGTHWSPLGQVIILLLIQTGGLGFMTSSTLLLLVFGRRVTLRQRLVIREALGTWTLSGLENVVRQVIAIAIVAEVLGMTLLTLRLAADRPLGLALWYGLFHSVSAFNNAGFDLFGDFRSLAPYRDDPLVLPTIGGLTIAGGIGVFTLTDLWRARSWRRLAINSKLVLSTTALLLVVGTVSVFGLESGNAATLGDLPLGSRVLNAAFHSVTPRTAGFTSLDMASLTQAMLAVTIVLMFIGGAPGSTAGGIKVTTFSGLLAAIVSTVRGRAEVEAFGREIPQTLIFRALTVALLAVALVMGAAILLTVTEGVAFIHALFEATSAFGAVGLTTGLTPGLTPLGKLVLITMMFAGRLGPLTLALALAQVQRPARYRHAAEPIMIG